jgi:hypothetical protein
VTARRPRGDDGSAVVEFVTLGVLMLLPVMYLVLTLGRVQAAAYATDGSARAAARAVVTAPTEQDGMAAAVAAVRLGLLDQGFDTNPDAALTVRCSAPACLTPTARVQAQVSVDVVLPGVPAFLDRVVPTHVSVTSRHVVVVDRFRATAVAP